MVAQRYHDTSGPMTGCLAKHPHDDHGTVGAFRHIETMELREEDVDDLFFSEDESDEVVEARFVNDGDDDVDIYWRVLKLETLEAGKETAFETTAGSRWSFRQGEEVLKSVRVGRAARNVYALQGQSFDAHPVEMTLRLPGRAPCLMRARARSSTRATGRTPWRRTTATSGAPTTCWEI